MDASQLNTILISVVGSLVLLTLGLLAWIGNRAVDRLDEVVAHLTVLNHRTTKLETRLDIVADSLKK